MIEESQRVRIQGYLLHRLLLHPEQTVTAKAAALFYHGQGDYAERYVDVLRPLTERGIRCIITELPGHGRSPGRRGHCGNVELLDAVIRDTLGVIGVLPYGVMGHSMGGLLAIRHLVLSGVGELPVPDFVWLSSPLMKPGNGRSALFLKIVQLLAHLVPSLTISTGVKPEMCRVKSEQNTEDDEQAPPKHQLWHSRVSIGWGVHLMAFQKLVADSLADIPADIPLLYTQGGRDPICPPEMARVIFEKLPNKNKQYHEFEELLHEPFRGDGSEALFEVLENWLDQVVTQDCPE